MAGEPVRVLTEAEFARRAYQIAARCHSWASECILYPEWFERPMHAETIGRFVAEIRNLVNRLEEAANRPVCTEIPHAE